MRHRPESISKANCLPWASSFTFSGECLPHHNEARNHKTKEFSSSDWKETLLPQALNSSRILISYLRFTLLVCPDLPFKYCHALAGQWLGLYFVLHWKHSLNLSLQNCLSWFFPTLFSSILRLFVKDNCSHRLDWPSVSSIEVALQMLLQILGYLLITIYANCIWS